jgi:cation:H+ antiporter
VGDADPGEDVRHENGEQEAGEDDGHEGSFRSGERAAIIPRSIREGLVTVATFGAFALGLVLLTLGGEGLVRGSSGIARRFGITPLVIGLTVVAFGTSAPELVVSLAATFRGSPDIAVGNVVGSNVFNVLAILGLCALAKPLVVAQQLVFRDVPVMIVASLVVLFFGFDGRIALPEGVLLVAGLVWFCWDSVRASRRESAAIREEYAAGVPAGVGGRGVWLDLAVVAASLALLVGGARLLVSSAVTLAQALGIDEAVIALTIVAAGTSLPEVATSLVATLRGERDIAVGNVVGSCIFNLFGILGVSAVASADGLRVAPAIESFDLPVMTATAVACLPLMARGHRIPRWQGLLFVLYYAAYTLYLVLASQQHAALARFSAVMLEFVVPFTVATIAAVYLTGRDGGEAPRAS